MKVFHTFTLGTGQVLMRGHIRIKPGLVIKGRDSGHKPAVFKGQKRPVDRVQRNGGNARLDPLVDGICRRMVECRGQFSEDLKTLMGGATRSKIIKAVVDLSLRKGKKAEEEK